MPLRVGPFSFICGPARGGLGLSRSAYGSLFWTDGLRDRVWRLLDRNNAATATATATAIATATATATAIATVAATATVTADVEAAEPHHIERALRIVAWSCDADLAEPFGVLDLANIQDALAGLLDTRTG